MVVVDYYSLWPEVYLLQKPNADGVIEAVKDAFSGHGIAEELTSDNGSQYSSFKFKRFQKGWKFCHRTSSPRGSVRAVDISPFYCF